MDFFSKITQYQNIAAAKATAGIIRTTLGPRSMLKMILDNQGGMVITNDGFCVLREIEIGHPAAKSLIELSRSQDSEIGDGTTTIVVLVSEFLRISEILLKQKFHPNQIMASFFQALIEINFFLENDLACKLDNKNFHDMTKVIMTTICTKLVGKFSRLICELSFKAIKTAGSRIAFSNLNNILKIEKIPFGKFEDSKILSGIMLIKDISHPKMRRKIKTPRIILLDCPIEYKKGESQVTIELEEENEWENLLKAEENFIIFTCNLLKKFNPDVIITEKGVSDLALHYLYKSNISVIRRIKKSENLRLARATGSTIISSFQDLEKNDLGKAGFFEVKKIGQEYYTFITGCKGTQSSTILLFGPSRDILDEIERNLHDALSVAKNIFSNPKVIPGGGATELAISNFLFKKSEKQKNDSFFIYKSLALAFEIIPKTLIENFGGSVIYPITRLRNIHRKENFFFGFDGKKRKNCRYKKN
mmetsp:Transcript_10666/g.24765  ORF Transcript_10666/g.24765 Transcript_10666/m.24765 type:complete len:476 (-) Transcript_10666:724-2151(-)